MAKFIVGQKVVAGVDSKRGYYTAGMVGVVADIRLRETREYLVAFEGRDKKVWTLESSLNPIVEFNSGDRVMTICDPYKAGLYTVGMFGNVEDYRCVDGGEYKVKFDSKTKKTWVSESNLIKVSRIADDFDDDTVETVHKKGIVLFTNDVFTAGNVVDIIGEDFGCYIVGFNGNEYDIEKQAIFIIPENKPFYVHILDLRKLRELGCEFKSDSGLCWHNRHFIAPHALDMIDESFVAKIEDDGIITFKYKDTEYALQDFEIAEGLVEFRD